MKKFFELITNKWLLKGTTTLILVAIVIAAYIALNWGAEKLNIEDLDFTTKKLYSLSTETKNRLKDLEKETAIQLINMADEGYSYIVDYVEKYDQITDKISIEKIDDLSSRVDLQTEYGINSSDMLIVIKSGDRVKALTIDDLYQYDYSAGKYIDTTEESITNAIVEVTIEDMPNVYVYTGKTHYAPEQVLSRILFQLEDEANNVEKLDILSSGNVPEDCDCLVMTTLKQDLSDFERDKILEYINRGGKILLLSSQNTLEVDTPNFDQILAQYGLSMEYGVVLEQDKSKMLSGSPDLIIADVSASFMSDIDMSLEMCAVSAGSLKFAGEERLSELGVTYEVLAQTSESSFIRTKFDQQTLSRTDKDSEEGSNILAAHVSKTITEDTTISELIIFANEVMATNIETPLTLQYYMYPILERNNEDIVMNSVSYLTERDDTIIIRKTDEAEKYTVTDQEDVIIKTIIFTVPVIIIVIGIGVWIFRRRKI